MYIARRTGGGRGVYEIAGRTIDGLTASDVIGNELALNLAPLRTIPLGILLKLQGGKPRLVLTARADIHIQRQIATLLMMPKPIRSGSSLGDHLPSMQTNAFVVDRIEMDGVIMRSSSLEFTPASVSLSDLNSELHISAQARFERVATIWSHKASYPDPIDSLISAHQTKISAGLPISAEAERGVRDLQEAAHEYSKTADVEYHQGGDVLDVLERMLPNVIKRIDDAEYPLPEELPASSLGYEGATKTITVNAYERSAATRNQCIAHYGVSCEVCGLNFEQQYGAIGTDFIHIHHLTPLSKLGKKYRVDPIIDLRPVCPNCHAMLHKTSPPYGIDELKRILKDAQEGRKSEE